MNEEMTFKELIEAKKQCEITIWQALTKLQAHTGLIVERVWFVETVVGEIGKVTVDVSIP